MHYNDARIRIGLLQPRLHRILTSRAAGHDLAQFRYAEHPSDSLCRRYLILAHHKDNRIDIRVLLEREQAPRHDWT